MTSVNERADDSWTSTGGSPWGRVLTCIAVLSWSMHCWSCGNGASSGGPATVDGSARKDADPPAMMDGSASKDAGHPAMVDGSARKDAGHDGPRKIGASCSADTDCAPSLRCLEPLLVGKGGTCG